MIDERSITKEKFIEIVGTWREEFISNNRGIQIFIKNDETPKKIKSMLRKYNCDLMRKYSC